MGWGEGSAKQKCAEQRKGHQGKFGWICLGKGLNGEKVMKLSDWIHVKKLRVWITTTLVQFLPAEVRSKYILCHERSNARSCSIPDTLIKLTLSSCWMKFMLVQMNLRRLVPQQAAYPHIWGYFSLEALPCNLAVPKLFRLKSFF